jgi:hypothetical protein
MPIAPTNRSLWTPEVEAASEALWQKEIASKLTTQKIIQAGSYFFRPPAWGAASLIAYEDPASIKYIKVFSHHNYAQGPGASNPSVRNLMNHTEIFHDVQGYADDVNAAHKIGREYVFGETNSGE